MWWIVQVHPTNAGYQRNENVSRWEKSRMSRKDMSNQKKIFFIMKSRKIVESEDRGKAFTFLIASTLVCYRCLPFLWGSKRCCNAIHWIVWSESEDEECSSSTNKDIFNRLLLRRWILGYHWYGIERVSMVQCNARGICSREDEREPMENDWSPTLSSTSHPDSIGMIAERINAVGLALVQFDTTVLV